MLFLKSLALASTLIVFTACSSPSKVEQKVAEEIKNEKPLAPVEVSSTAREMISKSTNFSADQKKSLLDILTETQTKTQMLNTEMSKVKQVLMKTLLDPKSNDKEVMLLKRNLKRLSQKQVETTLSAIDKAHLIISPNTNHAEREFIYNSFLMKEPSNY